VNCRSADKIRINAEKWDSEVLAKVNVYVRNHDWMYWYAEMKFMKIALTYTGSIAKM